ncbi:ATP-dependent nuclease [Mesorhizobium sp. NZP2298]|uniref:ATP-dependent nuclease n=1 Tax=Mesorhizobium sp. NZP2298 TaxID=2483403 RepID=UPI001555E4B8|nr:ATP-binding protein [Mesorhizobium sp. NZP2298]QKC94041.1 hypothetical protein EB231_04425 [Mesorhizobium sp. NZP2298]
MRVKRVHIQNFKAVVDVNIELTDVTLLVGSNNSGKSSTLQAIHFACRAFFQASEANKQSTISLRELEYVPSEDYRELAHNDVWGNRQNAPESAVSFTLVDDSQENSPEYNASLSLKSARNEGIAINPDVSPQLIPIFRSRDSVFSSYIPGIAGIPLQEQRLSKRQVYRKAASGDSNVVLRNILLILQEKGELGNAIDAVREVYADPTISITAQFNNDVDYNIRSTVLTSGMGQAKPLEYSGTGILQVVQIFSYLYLFRPKVILIDEPEAHLHPTLQTRLLGVLQKRVRECGSAALITTHSPFIAAGLSEGAQSVWLERGNVAAATAGTQIRDALGWGALDKKIILCAEDRNIKPLETLLFQDADLFRDVSVIPFSGVSKLGSAAALRAFLAALGNRHRLAIYRDKDCLTDSEIDAWFQDYGNAGFGKVVSSGVEIENYFCLPEHLSARLGLTYEQAKEITRAAFDGNEQEFETKFRAKRQEANLKFHRDGGSPETNALWAQFDLSAKSGGKILISKINAELQRRGLPQRNLEAKTTDVVIGSDMISQLRRFVYRD